MKRICVFCGSNSGARTAYQAAAQKMGRALAERKIALVYGGGRVGLMGTIADAILAAGGEAIGVIPEALLAKEVGHQSLTELRVVATMHERKAIMADLADAFVALPGGFGTFEEFCEVLTWSQLGIHRKACGLLNVEGYYDRMLALFDHAAGEGFVHPLHRSLVVEAADPDEMLDRLEAFQWPEVKKWVDQKER